jgi:hypothetical protein
MLTYKACPIRIDKVDWISAKLNEAKSITGKKELLLVLEKVAKAFTGCESW